MIETINGKAYFKVGDKVYELGGGSNIITADSVEQLPDPATVPERTIAFVKSEESAGGGDFKVINLNDYAIPANVYMATTLGEFLSIIPLQMVGSVKPVRITAFADVVTALLPEFDTDAPINIVYSVEQEEMSLAYEFAAVNILRENGAIHQVSFGDALFVGNLFDVMNIGALCDIKIAFNEDGSIVILVIAEQPEHAPIGLTCTTCNGTGGSGNDCSTCDGTGKQSCENCGGSGELDCQRCEGTGTVAEMQPCESCAGRGIQEVDCEYCGGSGTADDGEGCSECGGTGKREEPCSHCYSMGQVDGSVDCGDCSGTGKLTCESCHGLGNNGYECGSCGGNGKEPCSTCGGEGFIEA